MSNKNRPRLSLKGDPNAPTTALTEPAPAVPNEPIQEKTMEAEQQKSQVEALEQSAPTAKAMAEAEEANAVRLRQLSERQQQDPAEEPMSVLGLAAQGREALLDGLRRHAEQANPEPYVPPPRTARQMSALEEELEAGRRSQRRAEEQLANRPVEKADLNKE